MLWILSMVAQYDGYSQSPRPGMPQGGPHFRPPPPPMGRMDSYGPPPPQPPPPSYGRTSAVSLTPTALDVSCSEGCCVLLLQTKAD